MGNIFRENRESKNLLLREVAASLKMDTALLSKIERGVRHPNRDQVIALAKFYKVKSDDLLVTWLGEKLASEVQHETFALKAMQVAVASIKLKGRSRKKSNSVSQH